MCQPSARDLNLQCKAAIIAADCFSRSDTMFVDQTVYHGRAEDTNRLDKELRCYDLLDRLGLS